MCSHIYYRYPTLGQAPEIFVSFFNFYYLCVLGFGFLRRSTSCIHAVVCASVFNQIFKVDGKAAYWPQRAILTY